MFRVLWIGLWACVAAASFAVAAVPARAPQAAPAVTAESEEAKFLSAFGTFARSEQTFRRLLVLTLSRTVSVHALARTHGKDATEDALNAEIDVVVADHLEQWTRNMLNAYLEVLGEDATRSIVAEGRNSPHFGEYASRLNDIGKASRERNEPLLKQAAAEVLTGAQRRLERQ